MILENLECCETVSVMRNDSEKSRDNCDAIRKMGNDLEKSGEL